ncbi:MAG TPA: hypothetical protein VLF14_09765 [Candidatus Binatia bacterium]|nr:hypothetical protein [Candidatus Binatia bacterium]
MLTSVAGNSRRSGRLPDLGGLGFFCVFLAWLVARSIHSPHWNWDLVPYVACVLEGRFPDPADLQAATFEEIRRIVPPSRFAALTTGDYFGDVFRDPEALRQQLPFYRIKPAYLELLRLLASAGLSPVTATLAVSIAASVSFAVLVFFWLRIHLAARASGPCAVLLSLLIGLPIVARISTPDAISGCCLLVALYALCERAALGVAALAIVLSVAIRSDNVIIGLWFAALFFALDRREDRLHPWRHAATALGVVAVYTVSVRGAAAYPWTTFFVHSFGAPLSRPAEWHGSLSLRFYLAVLARNAHMFLDPQAAAMALLGVVAFVQLPVETGLRSRLRRSLPPTLLLLAVVRYLLYPFVMGRHLFPFYAAVGALFLTSNAELAGRFGLGAAAESKSRS